MTFKIDYEKRIQSALRISIRQILQDVAKNGLPGNHHFYISFKSQFPGVEMSKWLYESYPEEMTIVIQNWFEGLIVNKEEFSIILNFNNSPEKMTIPFQSILNFSDPSVNFSLQFEAAGDEKSTSVPEINIETHQNNEESPKKQNPKSGEDEKNEDKSAHTKALKKTGNVIDFESFKKI